MTFGFFGGFGVDFVFMFCYFSYEAEAVTNAANKQRMFDANGEIKIK